MTLWWIADAVLLFLVVPIVVELDKLIRRRHLPGPAAMKPAEVVNPSRALVATAG